MLIPFLLEDGKYSLIDSVSLKKTWDNFKFEYLGFFKERFARVKYNNKWFYIDKNENELFLKHNYERIEDFENGLAPVFRDDSWRFINKSGIEVSKRGYRKYYHKQNGFIEVIITIENGEIELTGLIDKTGFEVVPPESNCIIDLCDGLILISYSKRGYSAFDLNGEQIFNANYYSFVSPFYQNRAIGILHKTSEVYIIDKELTQIKKIGIESHGRFDFDIEGFRNGLLEVKYYGKFGLINVNGEIVCDFQYDSIQQFYEGYAIVGKEIDGQLKYSFINSKFKEVIPFKYDKIDDFSEGFAAVELAGKWGLINSNGDEVIKPEFTKMGSCKNGLLWVGLGDFKYGDYYGKYGFLNTNGEKICPIIYDNVEDFGLHIAKVQLNEKYGFINKQGTEITNIKFDNVLENHENFYFVEESGLRYVINEKGQEFTEMFFKRSDKLPF